MGAVDYGACAKMRESSVVSGRTLPISKRVERLYGLVRNTSGDFVTGGLCDEESCRRGWSRTSHHEHVRNGC